MSNIPENKQIILFDGVCNLCNSFVNLVIRQDKKDRFRFASLQSEIGRELIEERNLDPDKLDSIILINPGVAYYLKSTAALQIAKHLSGGYKLLSYFSFLPENFRDFIYTYVANNRYKWYGKKEQCMLPSPEIKAKFLE
ncbi:putative DCC family thiol-disulfide oxidoreductase YuxK [Mesonia hippocampi]|uniref:Putative DCC family thiol-disulfide oxidoreductase YuxK n=1 Tax=Mesonia hippocampi TaxID=1628250 RepID=A0A840EM25_9FLAO|nr:thiol-disulfide oxidoreductase DCC family protein [Mesonia hippocampi]MBB4119168.1 putative DCC family thiol-disulfide oxidoreductase YuxK [Mesonia hippocampi]